MRTLAGALDYIERRKHMLHLHILILFIVTPALLVIGGGLLVIYFRNRTDTGKYRIIGLTDWTHEGLALAAWTTFGVGLTTLLVLTISLIPFSPKYWVLTEHTGELASISNRFVEGTGDVSGQTYTLTFVDDPTPRVITDSRILGLEAGDTVSLTCSLEWVYGGADRSNCYMRSF